MTQRFHLLHQRPDRTLPGPAAARVAAVLIAALIAAFGAGVVKAQSIPDAGSLLRENRRDAAPLPPRPAPPPLPAAPPAAAASAPAADLRFTVAAFRLQGASLIPEAQLQAALAPWLNRPLDFAELQQALQALADAYASQGWLARPQLPAQDMVGGVVTINILEARLGQVRIDPGAQALRFDRSRIEQTLTARQAPGQPLRPQNIERAISLLNDTPGLRASAVLAAGEQAGETDIVVLPVDQPRWSASVQADNEGASVSGADRLSVTAALDSPAGIGDQLLLTANTSGAGNAYAWLAYSLPLGGEGWRIGANASALRYRLGGVFANLAASGDAQTLGLFASYPLLRTREQNITATLALDRRDFLNDANGQVISDKHLSGLGVGVNASVNDDWAGGGLTLWGATLVAGRVDLSATPSYLAADQAGPQTQGHYTRLAWNLSRLQRLSEASSLWLSASGQAASKNLDSADKFTLGGARGVRAYPPLEGSGDSGVLASAEWRINLQPTLQGSVFYDYGQVRVNQNPGYTGAAALNQIALQGVGVGVNWALPGRYAALAMLARRIGNNPLANPATGKDSDGSAQILRLWVGLAAYF